MPNYADAFRSHAIFETIENVAAAHESIHEIVESMPPEAVEDQSRIRYLITRIRSDLASTDPLAAVGSYLDAANSQLAAAQGQLNYIRSNRTPANLTQANVHVESAASNTNLLPKIGAATDVSAIHEAIVSFKRSIAQHLRNVEDDAKTISARVAEAGARLDQIAQEVVRQTTRVDEAIARFESQFSQSEADRRMEGQQAIARVQQQGADIEERFVTSQNTRQEAFNNLITEFKTQIASRLSEAEENVGDEIAELSMRISDFDKFLKSRREEVEKLVGAVAQTGMVAGYQKVANDERTAMKMWQSITVGSILAFVLLMLVMIFAGDGQVTWSEFSGRVIAALGFAALAGYAGREGAKHAEKERINRQLELEIATVGPFLATLPKEQQDEMKKELAGRAFGRGPQPLAVEEVTATTSGLMEIVRMAMAELLKRR